MIRSVSLHLFIRKISDLERKCPIMIRLKTLSKKLGSESGALLMASTMGIFILLSLFAFYLSRLVIQESRNASFHALDIKARNLALTGIEHAMQSYKMSRNISNITDSYLEYMFILLRQKKQGGS